MLTTKSNLNTIFEIYTLCTLYNANHSIDETPYGPHNVDHKNLMISYGTHRICVSFRRLLRVNDCKVHLGTKFWDESHGNLE